MDKNKPSKDERGNVRYLWALVGAYLLYLAWQQLQLILRGEAVKTGDVILCVVSGAVFAAVGAWVIFREWQAWRYAQTHEDDPETRGDVSEQDNMSADADAPESLAVGAVAGIAENTDAQTDADSDEESGGNEEGDEESGEDDEGGDEKSDEDEEEPSSDSDDGEETESEPDEDD